MQTLALDLLHALLVAFVLVCRYDCLHLLRLDCEASGCRPDAVALAVEDGGSVDIAGSDEAGEFESV